MLLILLPSTAEHSTNRGSEDELEMKLDKEMEMKLDKEMEMILNEIPLLHHCGDLSTSQ